ncbi:hypothetical protein N0V88_007745 [Collariella sp. IMI 366227]|nr:hypothetical protein N0V88_007745 [Collariella sp. IMI 366227]
MASKQQEPIAIVGSGCRFPGGANSPSALWKLLERPTDVGVDIGPDRFDATAFYHPDGSHHGTSNVLRSYLLQEDVRVFDAAFFNLSPNEADSMDPQQRLLLETVYEALEGGGHTLEALRGSDTAVFVGTMTADYNDTLIRDHNTMPNYFATGTNRAIISNRVSYFFDWHGPSMTIDTACSSSLIAVHQSVKALRAGDARVAMACGTQVLLNPEMYIGESKLKMLSPNGRSAMWDADADGYARGEGIAAVVLKRLSDAIADGDYIQCIVRETGANQDGFSNGITVPNTDAQASLIRQTYARAGLDPENEPRDRPQFFEAHGTGTQAGDPKEAAAIHQCFGQHIGSNKTPLYVGSVKTVIGHLEGCAGLAGVLKGAAMIQSGFVAPNLHFNRLNPKIEPFSQGLHVPTKLVDWPEMAEGVPRRVSVNSFEGINASDLAWTLHSRRSHLPNKAAFSATTLEQLASVIDTKLAEVTKNAGTAIGNRSIVNKASTPQLMGVFTGQGAQWPAMGAELIRSSAFVRERIQHLEDSLATLPPSDRPEWCLVDEMLAGADVSRIAEAALSQPLCTAVQVVLVDLLRAAGITFAAVVGHSSGEIAAAYAAGFVTAHDAIRIAYYRGLYARFAGNESTGQKGAMMAVGTSWEEAQQLVSSPKFKGRLAAAAHNSPASVTFSGDADAVAEAKEMFDDEKKFARMLKVDTAYHSHHMVPCGERYVQALRARGIQVNRQRADTSCTWFSSVTGASQGMEPVDELQDIYWRDNMTGAVLFSEAVKNAVASTEQLALAIEVGPHPALKGPTTQNVSEVRTSPLPYCGALSRGKNDVEAFAEALGFVWTQLPQLVNFQNFEKVVASSDWRQPKLVVGLPSYRWNHGRSHWSESRISRRMRTRKQGHHEILGFPSPESNSRDLRWSNVLKQKEIPWLDGHQLQGQTVFPAAGYVAMALEASRILAGDKTVEMFELHNLVIPKAITFEEGDNLGVETLVTLTGADYPPDKTATADFACYSTPVLSAGSEHDMELTASGTVKIVFGTPHVATLSTCTSPEDDYNMSAVDAEYFYSTISELGYNYSGPFKTLSFPKRKLNNSSALVDSYIYLDTDVSSYLVHPSMLDVAFQASMLAYSAPGDERLWSLSVPTAIGTIRVNPEVCAALPTSGSKVPVHAVIDGESESFLASIDLFSEDGEHGMVQVEDLALRPFAPATSADDLVMFTHIEFGHALPDGVALVGKARPSVYEMELAAVCERIAHYYLRAWKSELSDEIWANKGSSQWLQLRDRVNQTLSTAARRQHPTLKREWVDDILEDVQALIARYPDSVDVKLLTAVGQNLVAAVQGHFSVEKLLPKALLDDWYKNGLGFATYRSFLANTVKQVVHRYPHAKILEIAAEEFKAHSDKMTFTILDINEDPAAQGFKPHSYDIVVACHTLSATSSVRSALENVRQLLRPGGYLILNEITSLSSMRCYSILGATGKLSLLTLGDWYSALRKAGFGGVDVSTPEIDFMAWPLSIITSQAIDDRVQFLRRPLTAPSPSPPVYLESVVILGNGTLETARIGEKVAELLGRFCGEIIVLNSMPTEKESLTLNPSSTFLNLVDLDSPIFADMTDEKMNGLKRMLELANCIVWVTHRGQLDNPYHAASISFGRSIRQEAGHISFCHIDISDLHKPNVSPVIAKYLLQQSALDQWEAPPSTLADSQHRDFELLWSREPEVLLDNGALKIPRLMEDKDKKLQTELLFANMSGDVMRKVLGPKIDGSKNLDDVFYDDDLDFFIMFSSAVCVFGNAGQSNYAAANGFLDGLARQRRKRGLTASAIDLGRVTGIGYVEAAGQAVQEQLVKKLGLPPVSEMDLRQLIGGDHSRCGEEEALEILQDSFETKLRIMLQLGDQKIEHDAPLLELGIDSLVAVEVRSWFLKELKVDIPVLKIVGGASLADLCQRALEKLPDEFVPSSALLERPIADLKFLKSELISLPQSRFWFLRHLLEDPTTPNVVFTYHVAGNLRIGDLERAIRLVTNRHEALRTCFVEDETEAGEAYQRVLPSSSLRLKRKKIESAEDVASEYKKLRAHVFDLQRGDVMRMVLLTLSSSSHYLLINYHHIVMDGASFNVFLSDLETAYNGRSLGAPPRQYPEFSATQRQALEKGDMKEELKYWRELFPASEQPPVLPLLPMARTISRVAMKGFDSHQVMCHLKPELVARIKATSRSQRSTAFHLHVAAFKALLFSVAGEGTKDLTIGIADAARNDDNLNRSIGFFLNLLTLRFRRKTDQTFAEAIIEARNTTHGALRTSRLPFDVLLTELNVARSSSHSPFFQAFLDYRQGIQTKHPWANCQFELQDVHPGRTAYDVTLDVTELNSADTLVMFRVQKCLYDLAAANLLLETYVHLLDVLTSDPSLALKDTPLFGEKQLARALQIGRGPNLVSDWPPTLPHRIDQVAQEHSESIALMDGTGKVLTYSDMANRIGAIGEALQNVGITAGSRVLVYQQPAADWPCSMLAIMRLGAVYVPLDLRNPITRLAAVAKDCEPRAILVDNTTLAEASQLLVQAAEARIINVSVLPHAPSTPIANRAQSDLPAAILYTSGSTGTPKGIVVTHAGLRNEIEGYTKTWGLGAERVLQQSAFTFNHSSDQMYTGLVNGGMVYIVPAEKRGDPVEITKILQQHSITYTKATPSEYSLWIQFGGDTLRQAMSWRFAFGGGEPLTSIVTQEFANLNLPQLRFFNSYGPTEVSISSHKMDIPYREKQKIKNMGRIPCGYSLPNYHTYIVDEQLRPVPLGMPGEICIGGAGVSIGYLNNSELTNKHFVPNPFATSEDVARGWTRMYRTGDIGHLQEDGAMVFQSRMAGDSQVKIRGLRIELSDIESNIILAAGGALREAVVTLRHGESGDPPFLVAHVVFARQHSVTGKDAFLQNLLSHLPIPQYMVPVVAIPLDKFPLSNHSKVDRKAVEKMPLPDRVGSVKVDESTELSETMLQLKRAWRDVIGPNMDKFGFDLQPSTDFFLVGGNSLLAIRLQARIRQIFNVALPLVKLMSGTKLSEMSCKIEQTTTIDPINWDNETSLPSIPSFLTNLTPTPTPTTTTTTIKTILLTGATGFSADTSSPTSPPLNHHQNPLPRHPRQTPLALPFTSPKISYHTGDLSLPLLGLGVDEFRHLASQVDAIIHLGAVRSFWDNYHTLKSSNVHPVKELVKMAVGRKVPVHFVSTVGVLPQPEDGEGGVAGSAAGNIPPTDGSEGYAASKWAGERILERAAEKLGVPARVYRFLPAPAGEEGIREKQELMNAFIRSVDASGAKPDMSVWRGRVDLIPARRVVEWLGEAVVEGTSGGGEVAAAAAEFVHYASPVSVHTDDLSAYIEQQRSEKELKPVPVLKWFGRIKALGFDYLLASQKATPFHKVAAVTIASVTVDAASAGQSRPYPSCRKIPGDAGWPGRKEWQRLNTTVDGRLIATVPVGHVCHDGGVFGAYNETACADLREGIAEAGAYTLQKMPGEVLNPYYQNLTCSPFTPISAPCELGGRAVYSINVRSAADVQAGLRFARKHNVRLVIKSTGIDYMGKSTGQGALSLWMFNLKSIEILKQFKSRHYSGPAVKLGSGVIAGEAYQAVTAAGYRIVAPECGLTGIVGGYTQGVGHSQLSTAYGLAADQVLEWEVVTPTGEYLIATPEKHSDLYWALSGGGGGTYSIVLSATVKAYPDGPVAGGSLVINNTNDTAFWEAVAFWFHVSPFFVENTPNNIQFLVTNATLHPPHPRATVLNTTSNANLMSVYRTIRR